MYQVQDCPWFQASTGGLGMYPPADKGGHCTPIAEVRESFRLFLFCFVYIWVILHSAHKLLQFAFHLLYQLTEQVA